MTMGHVPVQTAPIKPVLDRVREIAGLERDWDSHGAPETSPIAVAEAARLLLRSLDTTVYEQDVAVDAAPLSDGGVIVEWDAPARRFQVWIHGDGSRSGVVVKVEGGRDVEWLDLSNITDATVAAELRNLFAEPGHA